MTLESDFKKLSRQVDRLVKGGERNIGRQYASLLKTLRHEMSDWFAKYSDADGKLHYSELQKYDRIEKLEKNLREKIRKGTVPVAKEIRDTTRKSLTTAYTGTIKSVGEHSGRTIRGVLDPKKLQSIVQSPHSGLKLNERLQMRRGEVERRIRETLTQGLVRGESYKDMAGRLKNELEGDAAKAMRIVRTESHRVTETSKHEALEHAHNQGVEMKHWWLDSSDLRVRDSHEHMGKKYSKDNAIPFEEDFVNDLTGGQGPHPGAMGTPEDDIFCRCKEMVIMVTN